MATPLEIKPKYSGSSDCEPFESVIHIAGNYEEIKRLCKIWCFNNPWCVSMNKTDFVYCGGQQSGATIRGINYCKYPETPESLSGKIMSLAQFLLQHLHEKSCTIVLPQKCVLLTNPNFNDGRKR